MLIFIRFKSNAKNTRKLNNYFKTFINTFLAVYILSLLFLIIIIQAFASDRPSDAQICNSGAYFGITLMTTLILVMCLPIGINLNLKSAKAKKLIIYYSTCTDSEKLSIEFKSDCSYFYVKELTKPSRLTLLFW
jgi:hypothetical protein